MIDSFAHILRRSFFVSLYAFLESQLAKECEDRKGDDVLLRLSDLRGDVIHRVKTYMVKVLRISFPSTSPEWQRIRCYRILRNCIVHNEGRLDERFDQNDAKSLKDYIDDTSTLSLSDVTVVLSKDFCEEALQTVERFFRLLYKPWLASM